MIKAAETGDIAQVQLLLTEGADVNAHDDKDFTPLMCASKIDVLQLLIIKGADVNAKSKYGRTALMSAASNGNDALVKLLLDNRADPNIRDANGESALLDATEQSQSVQIRFLLTSENEAAKERDTEAAAQAYDRVEKFLINKGADVNAKDNRARTPLSWAVQNGSVAQVKVLLAKGADVNAKDSDGRPVFMWSTDTHPIMQMLIANRLDVNGADDEGQTLLMYAVSHAPMDIIKLSLPKERESMPVIALAGQP